MATSLGALLLATAWLACSSSVHATGNTSNIFGSNAIQTLQSTAEIARQLVNTPLHPYGTFVKTDFSDLAAGESPPAYYHGATWDGWTTVVQPDGRHFVKANGTGTITIKPPGTGFRPVGLRLQSAHHVRLIGHPLNQGHAVYLTVPPCTFNSAVTALCNLTESQFASWPQLDKLIFAVIDNPPNGTAGRHLLNSVAATAVVGDIILSEYQALLLPINAASMASQAATTTCAATVTVKAGDTCYSIYTAAGITADEFAQLNPGINCGALQVGQTVCIKAAPTCTKQVTVKNGDTCYSIWTAAGLTEAEFTALNPGVDCTKLQAGQSLCVAGASSCSKTHTVVSGDSCYSIWTAAGITQAQLEANNPGLDCSNLQIGQVLCVDNAPTPPPPSPPSSCTQTTTVKSGDSCWSIYTAAGITQDQFYQLNPGINCAALQVGQEVCIKPTSTCAQTVTVKSGDTCYAIYTAAGLTEAQFLALNPGLDCSALQVGQTVCVSNGGSPPGPPEPVGGLNVGAYWGQGDGTSMTEPSLAASCTNYNLVYVSFLINFGYGQNVANGMNLAFHSIAATGPEITQCQSKGVKVILSMGGAVGNYGFSSAADAIATADQIWNVYLGGSASNRPFGTAVLDGVDLDVEHYTPYYPEFVVQLNSYYTKAAPRKYIMSAAPQCIFPDANIGPALSAEGMLFDLIGIQFYNNPSCDGTPAEVDASYTTKWALFSRTFSPAPMLVVGLPAAAAAAPAGGYMSPSDAATAIKTAATQNTGTAWGFFVYSVATDFSNSANGVPYSAQVRALLS
ncbi:g11293 [Coccomyxa viridis]|uniref:G11293 protein n=1 Tax=Coccomyxa viridis TaxID=1274662 RepID=A0ABP1GBR1_9CHLO